MEDKTLNVGIDFSRKRADVGLFGPKGEYIKKHIAFKNSRSGYEYFKEHVLEAMEAYGLDEINVSGEATSYYWLPFFMAITNDLELNEYKVHPYLLNPRWVSWYKKCFAPEHKTDTDDPFFIAERTRTLPKVHEWTYDESWFKLRLLTRFRFHLVQGLAREKNFYQAYLFVLNSAYTQQKPFNNMFGKTSTKILRNLCQIDLFTEREDHELAKQLQQTSRTNLSVSLENAQRLKKVATERFPVDPELSDVLQHILNYNLDHIQFIEALVEQVNKCISEEARHHPEVAILSSIPGIGPVFANGIAAEIAGIDRFLVGQKYDRRKKQIRNKNLRDADASVAKYAGLWWPRNASGDFESDERILSKTGNRYLRYYLIEAADRLRQWSPVYAEYYQKKYAEVKKFAHKRALVLTARKSIRLYVGLLHRMKPYRSQEVRIRN
jgi:transposase